MYHCTLQQAYSIAAKRRQRLVWISVPSSCGAASSAQAACARIENTLIVDPARRPIAITCFDDGVQDGRWTRFTRAVFFDNSQQPIATSIAERINEHMLQWQMRVTDAHGSNWASAFTRSDLDSWGVHGLVALARGCVDGNGVHIAEIAMRRCLEALYEPESVANAYLVSDPIVPFVSELAAICPDVRDNLAGYVRQLVETHRRSDLFAMHTEIVALLYALDEKSLIHSVCDELDARLDGLALPFVMELLRLTGDPCEHRALFLRHDDAIAKFLTDSLSATVAEMPDSAGGVMNRVLCGDAIHLFAKWLRLHKDSRKSLARSMLESHQKESSQTWILKTLCQWSMAHGDWELLLVLEELRTQNT